MSPRDPEPPRLSGLSRESLASNELTHAALNAGYEMLMEIAEIDGNPRTAVPKLLAFLSRPEIIKAVNAGDTPERVSEGMMRDRWDPHGKYFDDLLEWIQWKSRELWVYEQTAVLSALEEEASTITEFVTPIATSFQTDYLENLTAFKVEFLSYALLGEAEVRDHVGGLYEQVITTWTEVFERVIAKHGGTLRPGVDLRGLVEIITAVGDGLTLREVVNPTDGAAREHRVGLLATAVLALLDASTTGMHSPNPWEASRA